MSLDRRRRIRAQSKKGRARARAQAKVRHAVFERDGHQCQLRRFTWLGGDPELRRDDVEACYGHLTPHHLLKAGQGGEDSVENEVTLCAFHNDWVEDHPDLAEQLGLVRRRPPT